MTASNETLKKLLTLAAKHFGRDATTLAADQDFFEVLGINSLQAMELLTAVEESFDIEIPDYELQGVKTFHALASVIESRL
jgi:acyl carrier protein